jgi:hypothetical protein
MIGLRTFSVSFSMSLLFVSEGLSCSAQDMYFEKYFLSSTVKRLPRGLSTTFEEGIGSTLGGAGIGKSEYRDEPRSLCLPEVGIPQA